MTVLEPGYYTLGGHGPFKTRLELYEYLGIPEPKEEYWKCPKCNKYWKRHELKYLVVGFSGSHVCPECVFVSVEYYGRYTQTTVDKLMCKTTPNVRRNSNEVIT